MHLLMGMFFFYSSPWDLDLKDQWDPWDLKWGRQSWMEYLLRVRIYSISCHGYNHGWDQDYHGNIELCFYTLSHKRLLEITNWFLFHRRCPRWYEKLSSKWSWYPEGRRASDGRLWSTWLRSRECEWSFSLNNLIQGVLYSETCMKRNIIISPLTFCFRQISAL